MKIVKVKPFGVFKVTEQVIDNLQKHIQPQPTDNPRTIKEIIRKVKRAKSGHFIAIAPDSKQLFSFIPIIEKEQFFTAQFPDPIQLYYASAFANYQFAKKTRHNITFQKRQPQPLNFVSSYLYNWHLQYKISTIIFLHSTIEAFINYLMPDDFIYKQEYIGEKSDKFVKQTKEFSKEQTERYILFKEKLNKVIPQLTGIDFQRSYQSVYDKLLNLNRLRNDIIHLRSSKEKNQQYFHKVFDEVVNINLTPFVNAVRDFVNTIKPGFIEFEEVTKSKEPTFKFNFEGPSAFRLDISVFIKILDAPAKRIILNIPRGSDNKFQSILNWIMQNLDILAKEQLIYFPTVMNRSKDKVVIEINKTDRQIGNKPAWDG